jgi:drug/metabolite transporter (DMT)-like permease
MAWKAIPCALALGFTGRVPLSALALALAAAVLHASWNTATAGAEKSQPTMAVSLAVGGVALVPLVVVIGAGADASVVPYAIGSVAFRLAYLILLATAYERGPLSVVYPVSRGVGPVLVLVVSVGALGVSLSLPQAGAVVLVAAGVVAVSGLGDSARARDVAVACLIGSCIAGYTLVDKEGITHADPLLYLSLITGPTAFLYVALLAVRGGIAPLRAEVRPRVVPIGLAMVGAYGCVLAALELAPAAPVAAVRETSVVIATGMAAAFLRERVGPVRAAGAAAVTAGIVVLALA